jgi:hypothetical protein
MGNASDVAPHWSEWRDMAAVVTYHRHLKRTVAIALTVGTVFFAMNQLTLVLTGHPTPLTWLKVALTYLPPFCMSNFGILTATREPASHSLNSSASARNHEAI